MIADDDRSAGFGNILFAGDAQAHRLLHDELQSLTDRIIGQGKESFGILFFEVFHAETGFLIHILLRTDTRYFSLRDEEAEFNEDVLRSSITFRILIGLTLFTQAVSCNLFHPNRIAEGPFFVVERELVGDFQGRRLIFNAFDSLVATAEVRRRCTADFEKERVQCTDTVTFLSAESPASRNHSQNESTGDPVSESVNFAIDYRYDNELAVHLDYAQAGVPANPFRIFRGGESRGAAIQLYGDTMIPRSNVRATFDMTLIRESDDRENAGLPLRYFERRQYSYLGLPTGYELTYWLREQGDR